MDEATGEIGPTPEAMDEFSVEVACAWEKALEQARTPRTRKVAMRSAMVLGPAQNSVLPVLCRLARLGLGGKMAGGRQFVSWIHQTDFCSAVEWLIDHEDIRGPVNLASPNPITNRELMCTVRDVCGMSFGLPASRLMLEAGAFLLRTETELIIKSRRVVPGRLSAGGFKFKFERLRPAVEDLCPVSRRQ
jgi:NAD dependent epimerase/dehydratase family enzyme